MRKIHSTDIGFLIDMDGLLINSESVAHSVFLQLCDDFGGTFTKAIHSSILGTKSDYWSQFVVEHCALNVNAEVFREAFREKYREALDHDIALLPGARECIDWIDNSGLPKCLVTSSGSERTERNLELLGISEKFQKRVTAEMSPEGKPKPAPYLIGAELLARKPKYCVVLEDSMNGCISGADAGCMVIAVPTEFADKSGFRKARFIAQDLVEALDWIQSRLIARRSEHLKRGLPRGAYP